MKRKDRKFSSCPRNKGHLHLMDMTRKAMKLSCKQQTSARGSGNKPHKHCILFPGATRWSLMFTAEFWNIQIDVFTKIKLLWAPVMGSFQLLGQKCKWKCSNEKKHYIFFQRQIRRPCRRGCCGYLFGWHRTTTGTSDDGARSSLNFNWTIFGYLYRARCLQLDAVLFALRRREIDLNNNDRNQGAEQRFSLNNG